MVRKNKSISLPQTEIAVIFDFDITLSPHYMQTPIFRKYDVEPSAFWAEADALKARGYDDEHAYLKLLIEYVSKGRIPSLSNADLRTLGSELEFFEGFPAILDHLRKAGEDPAFAVGDWKPAIRFYVISSGIHEMIAGSIVAQFLARFWGCTLDEDDQGNIAFPKETISHTTKTQKLFLINKGLLEDSDQDRVNDYFPPERRPVPFEHMIYLGDGPSDVPCFTVVRKSGGKTIAVYKPGDQEAFDKCYELVVEADRTDLMCPADYKEGSHLYLALMHMVRSVAQRISQRLNQAAREGVIPAPRHSTGGAGPLRDVTD